ncbi:MAG: DUF948 domain-containing protein [Desulfobulbaceae bacterium]|nr:DUF948 domain-containing protein [Desulfobulbaceae bacterium]
MEMTISLTDLLLIIAGISIILLMSVLIPLLVQLKQTARRAERVLDNLNQDLPFILASLKNTADEMQIISARINTKLAQTDAIISTAKHAGESLLLTSNLIRSSLNPAITKLDGISTVIRTFFNLFHRPKSKKTMETQSDE